MTKCSYPDCENEAEERVYSRKQERVVKACYEHAWLIADEGCPEDVVTCPNCDCLIPVN